MRIPLENLPWRHRFCDRFPVDPVRGNHTRLVRNALYSAANPTPVSQVKLLAWSESLAGELGVAKPEEPKSPALEILGGNLILPTMKPYATRYGGHQFGHWAGQLGDGRAITLGEVPEAQGFRYREVQLKGAGPTPYSRQADGRAVLRSSIREYLASEAMHALGIPTTRALSLVLTGDQVVRDMFYDGHPEAEPGAIVCRVTPSLVRFGHFEILSEAGEIDLLENLVKFIVSDHYPEIEANDPDYAGVFFEKVCQRTAVLISHWMRVGFVHGVMNTDNMSIIGETIDYGPFGWLDEFDPAWTPNTTDLQRRRYRFGEQPRIGLWNLARLSDALTPLYLGKDRGQNGLETYQRVFNQMFFDAYRRKLGLTLPGGEAVQSAVSRVLMLLEKSRLDMPLFFRRLSHWWSQHVALKAAKRGAGETAEGSSLDGAAQLVNACLRDIQQLSYDDQAINQDLAKQWKDFLENLFFCWDQELVKQQQTGSVSLHGEHLDCENPKYILRNFLAVEAIDAATQGDLSKLKNLETALASPYQRRVDTDEKEDEFARKRPKWAEDRPGCSMLSCSS